MQQAITHLRQILSQQIIPRVLSEEPLRMIVAQRPLRLPPDVQAKRRPAPGLKVEGKHRSYAVLTKYHEESMHTIRFPYLCYVVEGEIDMRLGIPAQRGKTRGIVNHYDILTLPRHTALFIPSGVFFPDGTQPHWERPSSPAEAHLFWIHILPTGVICHTSDTRMVQCQDVFVPGQQFALLAQMQMEEMQLPDTEAADVAQRVLLLFLTRILRGLKEGARSSAAPIRELPEEKYLPSQGNSMIIERACAFIRRHINKPFRVEDVADYAYVSPFHLMRVFRAELQTTVMEYALKQRLHIAQSCLINSEIPIEEITRLVGYRQAPQFSRVFKQACGISPTEYRRRHRICEN